MIPRISTLTWPSWRLQWCCRRADEAADGYRWAPDLRIVLLVDTEGALKTTDWDPTRHRAGNKTQRKESKAWFVLRKQQQPQLREKVSQWSRYSNNPTSWEERRGVVYYFKILFLSSIWLLFIWVFCFNLNVIVYFSVAYYSFYFINI